MCLTLRRFVSRPLSPLALVKILRSNSNPRRRLCKAYNPHFPIGVWDGRFYFKQQERRDQPWNRTPRSQAYVPRPKFFSPWVTKLHFENQCFRACVRRTLLPRGTLVSNNSPPPSLSPSLLPSTHPSIHGEPSYYLLAPPTCWLFCILFQEH